MDILQLDESLTNDDAENILELIEDDLYDFLYAQGMKYIIDNLEDAKSELNIK
jgi:hypothetical protein